MKKEWKKTHTIYWSDELNDDFDRILSKRPDVKPGYKFIRSNHFANFFGNILYHGIAVPVLALISFFSGMKVEGRKNLKILKKNGGFIYSNHVSVPDVYKFATPICVGRRVNIIGYTDCLAVPILRGIVRQLGYLPLPNSEDTINKIALIRALKYYVKKKKQIVVIYPEAHIWPYYTKIRNFKCQTLKYPVMLKAPVVPAVTTWRKVWYCKKPKQTIKIGTPIFPREDFSNEQNTEYMYNETLSQMKKMAESVKQYEYIKYIYKENN